MTTLPHHGLLDEVLDFLASTPTPEQIVDFRPSASMQARVRFLLDQQRGSGLTDVERLELDEFVQLDHFMSMLKIRARQKLA